MTTTDQPPETHLRPWTAWLLEQRNGALVAELGEALAELTEAVTEHREPGTLTLVLKLKPLTSDAHALEVVDDVRVKAPTAPRTGSIFYPDTAGNLSRTDPRQQRLPLRPVADEADAGTTNALEA